ncbi:MAG: DUF3795 domain-containing protein [Anaerolineae bacterium]
MCRELVRFCGADCSDCETYRRFLTGDESWLVNADTGYRCCWLPRDYPRGQDCPIRLCCEERGLRFCGECSEFEACDRMSVFYSQPGYGAVRERMLQAMRRHKKKRG